MLFSFTWRLNRKRLIFFLWSLVLVLNFSLLLHFLLLFLLWGRRALLLDLSFFLYFLARQPFLAGFIRQRLFFFLLHLRYLFSGLLGKLLSLPEFGLRLLGRWRRYYFVLGVCRLLTEMRALWFVFLVPVFLAAVPSTA